MSHSAVQRNGGPNAGHASCCDAGRESITPLPMNPPIRPLWNTRKIVWSVDVKSIGMSRAMQRAIADGCADAPGADAMPQPFCAPRLDGTATGAGTLRDGAITLSALA